MKEFLFRVYGGILGFFCTLVGIVGLFFTPFVMLFIKWDAEPTNGSYNVYPTIRGDLPKWLSWFATPDERWPGGLYEPSVRDVLNKYGKYVCSLYWYTRNSMHGLLSVFSMGTFVSTARPNSDPTSYDYVQWQGLGLRGGYGWRWKPQNVECTQWALVPYFTVRLA